MPISELVKLTELVEEIIWVVAEQKVMSNNSATKLATKNYCVVAEDLKK